MKRYAAERLGKANYSLLELDFWKAASGEAFALCLLLAELVSWVAIIVFTALIASRIAG